MKSPLTIPRSLMRFGKYSFVGFSTFLIDFALLFLLTDILKLHYLWAAGSAFLFATSINYIVNRRLVFKGTTRSRSAGYVYFLLIASGGLLIVTSGMYLLVEVLGLYYLLARILVSLLTGVWSYPMNLFLNFKVAGKYAE